MSHNFCFFIYKSPLWILFCIRPFCLPSPLPLWLLFRIKARIPVIQAPLTAPQRAAFEESDPRWPLLPHTGLSARTYTEGPPPVSLGPPPPPFHRECAFPWFQRISHRALMSCDIRLFLPPTHTHTQYILTHWADVQRQDHTRQQMLITRQYLGGFICRGYLAPLYHLHRSAFLTTTSVNLGSYKIYTLSPPFLLLNRTLLDPSTPWLTSLKGQFN